MVRDRVRVNNSGIILRVRVFRFLVSNITNNFLRAISQLYVNSRSSSKLHGSEFWSICNDQTPNVTNTVHDGLMSMSLAFCII